MNGSGGTGNSVIRLAVCGVAPATSQPRKTSQAAKPSRRSRPRVEEIGVGVGSGQIRFSLDFLRRTKNSSISPGGSSCYRRVCSQVGDGLLPPPPVPREVVSSPGIRYPKGRVKSFRVESRWKASHWSVSMHTWVGSYYRLEEAMRAHDTTLHYTRKTPYYFVYPEGYFDPLPAGLEGAPPTEEFVTFVKIMAEKFAVDSRKLMRNPLSESTRSRKYVSRSKLSANRTSANKDDSQSKRAVVGGGRENEAVLHVQTNFVLSAAGTELPSTAVASSDPDASRILVSSAISELTSLEVPEIISHPQQQFQVPIGFDASNFDTDISIDDWIEKLRSGDSIGGDREDEPAVSDDVPNTSVLPADAARPPATALAWSDPKVPKDCNPSIADMDLSIDDYLETDCLSADSWMDEFRPELDDSTVFSFWADDTQANLVPSFTISGDSTAMPGPHNPTFGCVAACSEARLDSQIFP